MRDIFSITWIASFLLFFIMFFSLGLPEILIHNYYIETTCEVSSITINKRYCCDYTCTDCGTADLFMTPNCQSQILIFNQWNPNKILINDGVICGNGYHCCKTCWETLNGTSIPYCCYSTPNLFCTINCPKCFTVSLKLSYINDQMNQVNTTISTDFGKDAVGSRYSADSHKVGDRLQCYYNPNHYQTVVLDNRYTIWKWIIISFPIVGVLVSFLYFFLEDILEFIEYLFVIIIKSVLMVAALPFKFYQSLKIWYSDYKECESPPPYQELY